MQANFNGMLPGRACGPGCGGHTWPKELDAVYSGVARPYQVGFGSSRAGPDQVLPAGPCSQGRQHSLRPRSPKQQPPAPGFRSCFHHQQEQQETAAATKLGRIRPRQRLLQQQQPPKVLQLQPEQPEREPAARRCGDDHQYTSLHSAVHSTKTDLLHENMKTTILECKQHPIGYICPWHSHRALPPLTCVLKPPPFWQGLVVLPTRPTPAASLCAERTPLSGQQGQPP